MQRNDFGYERWVTRKATGNLNLLIGTYCGEDYLIYARNTYKKLYPYKYKSMPQSPQSGYLHRVYLPKLATFLAGYKNQLYFLA